MKTNSILPVLCCALLALSVGCAAPGAPQPPSLRLPQLVNNLSAVRKGSRVVLTWSPPTETTDHQPIHWPTTTRVCRVLNRFPIERCSQVAAEIKSSDLASSAPAQRLPVVSFEDVLPAALIAPQNLGAHAMGSQNTAPQNSASPSQVTYAIEVVNERGRSAGLSNQVPIPLLATEPPPASFRVTLDAQGPLLQWSFFPNPTVTTPTGVSCRIRIYRRSLSPPPGKSAAPVEFVPVAEQPCRPGPGEARDDSFEWEQEYDYKAAAVTVIATPGYPAAEVEGDDSSVAHVVTHDVFPPAVPRGLQAVFSSVGQKPFIDLVWEPNTERDLAGYLVSRSTDGSTAVVVSGSSPLKAPTWRDSDVHPGQSYVYTVMAVDVRGNRSAPSESATESVPRQSAPQDLAPQEVR